MSSLDLAAGIFFGLLPINVSLIGILLELSKMNKNKRK